MAASLSCPNFGAPARAGTESTQCEYCGCALATVSCPSCFAAMFAGMQFCPSCGAKADHDVEGDAKTLPCPGCKADMHRVRIGSTPMYECSSCASTWLDTETFTVMCSNREERGAVAGILGGAKEPAPMLGGPIRYLPCPMCKKLMNRTNFGHRSGVIIDVCKGHGAWFEPRELRNVCCCSSTTAASSERALKMRSNAMTSDANWSARLLKYAAQCVGATHHVQVNVERRPGRYDRFVVEAKCWMVC